MNELWWINYELVDINYIYAILIIWNLKIEPLTLQRVSFGLDWEKRGWFGWYNCCNNCIELC